MTLGTLSIIVAIIFVVLRLTEVIDWPWVWVLSPLWIGFILVLIIATVTVFIAKLAMSAMERDRFGD